MPPHIQQNFNNQCHELLQKVNSVKDQNRKIIYLDETVFSKLSLMNKEWSPKNSNLFVDSRQVYTGYRCAIASMSAEKGIELLHIQTKAVTADDFAKYLRKLR